ncbi:class I SAM-dependent methyltransferase [Mariniflexile ostreae]|uniref:Class I SAM-dependent methyltransferase n=1 Tax=Mariniflexile ostreae TaxID=1520892 RepID=A0ABV5FBG5_9FLAO
MSEQKMNHVYLKLKDYSVSGKNFRLVTNLEYGFLETRPKPSFEELPDYYKSEDYISHTDSKRNLFEKVYHVVRVFSLRKKTGIINSYGSGGKHLLDFGCGTGDFLQTAKQQGWTVVGVEPNTDARTLANVKTDNAVFDSDYLLTCEACTFDVITLWHVLEHLPNLEKDITLLKSLLKPNGILVVAVPNYKSYDAQYYKNFWAAYDVPRHLWHFNQKSISRLVLKQGLRVVRTKPMLFDAFYVSMLSEKYKTGKMNILKAVWVGLVSNLKSFITKEASSIIYIIKNN